jgi:calcineurin-like phosphoesterase family protein
MRISDAMKPMSVKIGASKEWNGLKPISSTLVPDETRVTILLENKTLILRDTW